MSTNQRGCLTLVGIVLVAIFLCVLPPFVLLPQSGNGITMPVITVPGEPLTIFGIDTVNTVLGMLLADVIVILLAVAAYFASNGWTKKVPGRLQAFMEMIVGGWWGITKQMAPDVPKVRNILFPLTASILLFLLAANLGKLIPGVESVGFIECAHEGFNGHPRGESGLQNAAGGYFLYNDEVFNVGTLADHHDYEVCHDFHDRHYKELPPIALDPFLDQEVAHVVEDGQTLQEIVAIYEAEAEDISEGTPTYDGHDDWYDSWADPHISIADIMERQGDSIAYAESADDGHSEDTTDHSEDAGDGDHSEVVPHEATLALEPGQTIVVRPEVTGAHATTENQQLYMVVPFLRGAATDLNLTLGLSLLAFVVIQWFGISTLGLGYFQKFINVHALGNLRSNPLGAIDFIAGLFEIVSEFGKIISLSFRLFGAIFAGGVLYAVILFLAGTVTPMVILLLEIVVGTAQAGVFAILTLIFSAQAMISHIHHDDDDHGHH